VPVPTTDPSGPGSGDAESGHARADSAPDQRGVSMAERSEFVVALLTDLQRGHYTPHAWWHFLVDSWRKSQTTAQQHPALTRSWLRSSALVAGLAAAGFSAIWLAEGQRIAWGILPALLICLSLQQGDVYVHLGLNWRLSDGLFRERLGVPTLLTLARGVIANLLLAHLLSGLIPLSGFALAVYMIGLATDIVDGHIARRAGWQTRLGGNLDGEADLFLSSSATLCAWLAGQLPIWLAGAMLARFAIPLIGALLSYFVAIRQVDFSHTAWGRSAGVAQSIFLMIALAPGPLAHILAPAYLPLLLVTLTLLVLAPVIGVRTNLRLWRLQKMEMKR